MGEIEAVTVRGVNLWRSTEAGPRGGKKVMYLRRLPGQERPNSFGIWHHTAREAIDGPCTASTGAGV